MSPNPRSPFSKVDHLCLAVIRLSVNFLYCLPNSAHFAFAAVVSHSETSSKVRLTAYGCCQLDMVQPHQLTLQCFMSAACCLHVPNDAASLVSIIPIRPFLSFWLSPQWQFLSRILVSLPCVSVSLCSTQKTSSVLYDCRMSRTL